MERKSPRLQTSPSVSKYSRNISERLKSLFYRTEEHHEPRLSKKMRLIHSDPNVYFIDNFLNESELLWLDKIITLNDKQFMSSFTQNDDNEEVLSSERTSTYIYLSKSQDAVIRNIERRASELIGITSDFVEPLQIVSYTKNQQFTEHHDAGTLFDNNHVSLAEPLRYVTLFLYLNTLPEGQGHTEFPVLNLSVTPKRGCGILFCNLTSEGEPDYRLIHKACPVEGNLRKLGVNIWIGEMSWQSLTVKASKLVKPKIGIAFDQSTSALSEADRRTRDYIDAAAATAIAAATGGLSGSSNSCAACTAAGDLNHHDDESADLKCGSSSFIGPESSDEDAAVDIHCCPAADTAVTLDSTCQPSTTADNTVNSSCAQNEYADGGDSSNETDFNQIVKLGTVDLPVTNNDNELAEHNVTLKKQRLSITEMIE